MSTARPSARTRGSFLSVSADEEGSKVPRNQEIKKEQAPPLVKVNWQVRPGRLEELKLHAVKSRQKLYQILDEALAEYLQHRRQA